MSCPQICAAVISTVGGLEPGGLGQFVAGKNRLQRDRRLRALMRGDVRVQRGDDFSGGGLFIRQIGSQLDDFRDDQDARLQTFGRAEIREQAVLQRRFLRLENHRLGFFRSAR